MSGVRRVPWLVAVIVAGSFTTAAAQPLGTFRWQLQPYCNVVTLAVVQQGGQYQLDGTDDQCGADRAAGVRGMAFQNANGSIGFGLSIITTPGGAAVHVDATIAISTLSGTWQDSAGNNGTFIFTPGAPIPGGPRPVPSGGVAPGTITTVQLAPGAVTNTQLAANAVTGTNVADGSIATADLAAPPRVSFVSGSQSLSISAQNQVVRSLSLNAPAPGTVLVTASSSVNFGSAATRDSVICSVTTGTTVDGTHDIIAAEETGGESAVRFVPLSYTRAFLVGTGSTTFRFLCSHFAGTINVSDSSLTALFIPTP